MKREYAVSLQGRIHPTVAHDAGQRSIHLLRSFDKLNGGRGPFAVLSMAGLSPDQAQALGDLVSDWLSLEFPS